MVDTPLLTSREIEQLLAARLTGLGALDCSLDLERSVARVTIGPAAWEWQGRLFPYPERHKARTIYYWTGGEFAPAARYSAALIKLVPTAWGAPTFEIDGIKMLPTAHISPYEDAERKVALIEPRGKVVLDTCGGLGYFAGWCVLKQAAQVRSFEKNADVLWLRRLNPWSPQENAQLSLQHGDVQEAIAAMATRSVGAILHDPPRFGIAGELYSRDFYLQLARVLTRRGKLFHYTGAPNRLASGRDLAGEVIKRLEDAGFLAERRGDGVLAVRL